MLGFNPGESPFIVESANPLLGEVSYEQILMDILREAPFCVVFNACKARDRFARYLQALGGAKMGDNRLYNIVDALIQYAHGRHLDVLRRLEKDETCTKFYAVSPGIWKLLVFLDHPDRILELSEHVTARIPGEAEIALLQTAFTKTWIFAERLGARQECLRALQENVLYIDRHQQPLFDRGLKHQKIYRCH